MSHCFLYLRLIGLLRKGVSMSFDMREYLRWTIVPNPFKYRELLDPDTMYEAMTFMSVNTAGWGARAYLTGGEVMEFKLIGHLATSRHLAAILSVSTVAAVSLAFGIIAAEAGGFDRTVGVTPSGSPSIVQGVMDKWTRKLS
jgi:hypothetical protein